MEEESFEDSRTIMSKRYGHSATFVPSATGLPDSIFVFGGNSDTGMVSNDLLRMNVKPNAKGNYIWTIVGVEGNKPPMRSGHVAAFLAGRFFFIFGGHSSGSQTLVDSHVIDLQEKGKGKGGSGLVGKNCLFRKGSTETP